MSRCFLILLRYGVANSSMPSAAGDDVAMVELMNVAYWDRKSVRAIAKLSHVPKRCRDQFLYQWIQGGDRFVKNLNQTCC
jgi:hypothetical protein